MKKAKTLIMRLYNIVIKPEIKILPGQLAFFIVMSIIPTIVLVGLICSTLNIPFQQLINFLNDTLPSAVSELLIAFINRDGLNITFGISMVAGFVLASNGLNSIIITSNTLYGIDHSNYISRRIKAFFLTIILLLLIVFTLIVLAFGNSIVHFILNLDILSGISNSMYKAFVLLKWPVGLFIIFFVIKLIFSIAPDKYIPSKYNNKGSIFTTVVWSIVTVIYSYYVTNFNNYNVFYGSLTNIILLMLWIYILSYVLVIGMAINVNEYKSSLEDNKK